jgi:membrane protease YdiL (CAAX protease family)
LRPWGDRSATRARRGRQGDLRPGRWLGDMATATGSILVGRAAAWPPSAVREGAEPSVRAILAILMGASVLELLAFVAAASGFTPSPFDQPSGVVTRLLLLPSALGVGISIAVVLLLGWVRASGLRLGNASAWGVVPVAALLIASVGVFDLPAVSSRQPSVLTLTLLGLLLAALAEEVLFRGFLLHGLARRLGGRRAVMVSSALFAAAHVPSFFFQPPPGGVLVTLVVLFGLGVFLSRIRAETGSIWMPTAVHTLWNFVTVGVIGSGAPGGAAAGFTLVKLAPVVLGVAIAFRLGRRPEPSGAVPPMPVAEAPPPSTLSPLALPPPPPLLPEY